MKNFNQLINEPLQNKNADTNEMIGLFLASMCLAYAIGPILNKGGSGGSSSSGASFWDFMINRDNNKQKEREAAAQNKNSDNSEQPSNGDTNNGQDSVDDNKNKIFNELLMLSKKSNEKEKDENTKKKNDALIKLLTACSFDKDGNELPLEDRIGKMKDNMSEDQFESFKKDMTETYEKNKDNQDFKDALVKAKNNIKPEDYDKMLDDAKKEAKSTLEQLEKEKKEIEEHEKKLEEIQKQIEGEKDDDKKKELQQEQTQLQQQTPQSMIAAATGVSSNGQPATASGEPAEGDADKKSEGDADKNPEGDADKKSEGDADKKSEGDAKDDKYKIQDEEIEDPKTGKKTKVKTYTGPRGGKFYYPEGSPKKPENKVYLESLTLKDYLLECLY